MKTARKILLLGAIALCGCKTAHDVAVSSFRVIDAPANYVRRHIDQPETTTTTTTTVATSDAVTPGRTVAVTQPKPQAPPRQVASTNPAPSDEARVSQSTAPEKPKPPSKPPSQTAASANGQYPTAKNVPGKPGYVFSPYDPNGGYVDVNGFTPGSKVKDPYSGKIFLVP